MKEKLKNLILALCCALMLGISFGFIASPSLAYAGSTPTPADSSGGTTSDLVNTGVNALGDIQEGVVKISMAIFSLSLIIAFICLLVTHDSRKISSIVVICGVVCLATLGIILVNNGTALKIIQDIANMFSA